MNQPEDIYCYYYHDCIVTESLTFVTTRTEKCRGRGGWEVQAGRELLGCGRLPVRDDC